MKITARDIEEFRKIDETVKRTISEKDIIFVKEAEMNRNGWVIIHIQQTVKPITINRNPISITYTRDNVTVRFNDLVTLNFEASEFELTINITNGQ